MVDTKFKIGDNVCDKNGDCYKVTGFGKDINGDRNFVISTVSLKNSKKGYWK